jgi:hypothetical protein
MSAVCTLVDKIIPALLDFMRSPENGAAASWYMLASPIVTYQVRFHFVPLVRDIYVVAPGVTCVNIIPDFVLLRKRVGTDAAATWSSRRGSSDRGTGAATIAGHGVTGCRHGDSNRQHDSSGHHCFP